MAENTIAERVRDTIYRARALLQTMAPVVRNAPLFRDIKGKVFMEFFDLLNYNRLIERI